jgi:hypothetical protein
MKVGALPPPLLSRTLVAMLLLPRAPQGRAVAADCDCCHFLKLWFAVLSQVVSMRVYAPPLICFILPLSIPFPLTEHALLSFSSSLHFAVSMCSKCVNYCLLLEQLLRRVHLDRVCSNKPDT